MEDYIVSARKYRPSTFKNVVGQKALTTTLKNAIQGNKLAHAYLFCGPRGVGKTSCARIFAKTINCLNLTQQGEACNGCESCLSFNEQRSFNIHELDAASNNSVDDIRSLTEQVRIPPQIGKYKVYIIDEVHMLSAAAFNAFLKTLEEPPHHAVFILATTEKQKILPTILSRCQIYDFSRITVEDIVEHLQYVASCENIETEPEALNVIAQKADGGMRDALSVFDQVASFTDGKITYKTVIENLNILDYEYYFRITDAILKGDVRSCMLILNEILEKGFDGQNIITGLTKHFRDLLVCKDESTLTLFEVGASIRERYKEMAKRCTDKLLFKSIELANQCDLTFRNSRNKRLLLELTLIQLCQQSTTPQEEGVKKKMIKPKTTSRIRTTSLKELGKEKEQNQNTSGIITTSEASDEFSQEELEKHWLSYAESLTVKKIHLKNTLMHCKPLLKDDFNLEVAVFNPSQEEKILENSPDLLSYLCRNLNNSRIRMEVRIVEKEEKEMIYTSKEKYNYLSKKNPNLEKLKEAFNLVTE